MRTAVIRSTPLRRRFVGEGRRAWSRRFEREVDRAAQMLFMSTSTTRGSSPASFSALLDDVGGIMVEVAVETAAASAAAAEDGVSAPPEPAAAAVPLPPETVYVLPALVMP